MNNTADNHRVMQPPPRNLADLRNRIDDAIFVLYRVDHTDRELMDVLNAYIDMLEDMARGYVS